MNIHVYGCGEKFVASPHAWESLGFRALQDAMPHELVVLESFEASEQLAPWLTRCMTNTSVCFSPQSESALVAAVAYSTAWNVVVGNSLDNDRVTPEEVLRIRTNRRPSFWKEADLLTNALTASKAQPGTWGLHGETCLGHLMRLVMVGYLDAIKAGKAIGVPAEKAVLPV